MSGYKRTRYIGFGSGISITPLNASNPIKTGQTTSYRTGDDGNLQIGRLVNFLTLDFTNPFGHTRRFTGITGGYHDGTDWVDVNGNSTTEALAFPNDIAIDWSQFNQVGGLVLGSVRTALSSTTWNNQIDNALALSVGAFTSGWRLLNANEANTFIDYSINGSCLSYHPFIMRTQGFIWLSTTYAVNTGRAMLIATANNRLGDAAKGNNSNGIAVRNFTLTELGLSGYGPCADATIEVNSNALTTVPSGGTLDIEVKYENGTPVGTIVSPTLVEIPDPITPSGIAYQRIDKNVEASSFINGDEWFYELAGKIVDVATPTYPVYVQEMDFAAADPFLTLKHNNIFGNKNRFTVHPTNADIIYDHLYAVTWWKGYGNLTMNMANSLIFVSGGTVVDGITFRPCTEREMKSIMNQQIVSEPLNWSPLNYSNSTTGVLTCSWLNNSNKGNVGGANVGQFRRLTGATVGGAPYGDVGGVAANSTATHQFIMINREGVFNPL